MKAFPPREREGVYRAIVSQRETHVFRPDPVPDLILARILQAARRAPSFGPVSSWKFVLIRDLETRLRIESTTRDCEALRNAVTREGLSTRTICEAPVNLCVACGPLAPSPSRNGTQSLDSADFLTMCGVVQNFWLAARAEGLGVAWIDIQRPDSLRQVLEIPSCMLPIALLCVGYSGGATQPRVAEKPREHHPDLTDLVYVNRWGTRADAEPLFRHLDDQRLLV